MLLKYRHFAWTKCVQVGFSNLISNLNLPRYSYETEKGKKPVGSQVTNGLQHVLFS